MDPEKKKLMVVGSLFLAMLGIGAFQFAKAGGESSAPAPAAKEAEAAKDGEKAKDGKAEPAKNPMYAAALTGRDPFQPAPFSASDPTPAAPVNPVAAAPVMPPRLGGGPVPSLPNPNGLSGELPPMPSGGLPGAGTLSPVAPPKPRFRGTLAGVVVGVRSAAVFRMADGDRIVPVGSEIEPGVRLVSVGARRASIRFHGTTITLTLRDEPFPASSASPSTPAAPKAAPASLPSLPSSVPETAPTLPDTGTEIHND